MPTEEHPNLQYVRIEVVADGVGEAESLLSVSSFLHDFNRLYEISRLAFDTRYREFHFKGPLAYGRQRPLASSDRFFVEKLSMGSPLVIVLILLALQPKQTVEAMGAFVRMLERLYNIPVEHRLRLADEKAKRAQARLASVQADAIEHRLSEAYVAEPMGKREEPRSREERAKVYLDRASGRLRNSDLSVERIIIEYVESQNNEPDKTNEK